MAKKSSAPTFDFSRVARGWTKRWATSLQDVATHQANLLAIEVDMQELAAEIANPPSLEQQRTQADLQRKQAEALAGIRACSQQQEVMICEVLVSVPDDWVHPSAPDDLDWSDAGSLDWLVDDTTYRQLLTAIQEARSAKN